MLCAEAELPVQGQWSAAAERTDQRRQAGTSVSFSDTIMLSVLFAGVRSTPLTALIMVGVYTLGTSIIRCVDAAATTAAVHVQLT